MEIDRNRVGINVSFAEINVAEGDYVDFISDLIENHMRFIDLIFLGFINYSQFQLEA
jgi:hypothetical protein